jgi:hypothetical protein
MQIPTEFNTFAMAALAGIGDMPDTITDRAVNISMHRRARGEKVSQFRSRRDGPVLEELQQRLADWVTIHIEVLKSAEPEMPVEDRAADTWEPLIAIADIAGGHWPITARAACTALVDGAAEADDDQSLAVRLLVDVRQAFVDKGVSFLPSGDLVTALRGIEESPWGDFEINPSRLAYRLRPFGIKPGRNTTGSVRGYSLESFEDAFRRYARQNPSEPSKSAGDEAKRADASSASDGLARQTDTARQGINADQQHILTGLTGSDAPPAETESSPLRPCRDCSTELLPDNNTTLCAECTYVARQEAIAIAQARLNGRGR